MEDRVLQLAYSAVSVLVPILVAMAVEYLRRRLGTEKVRRIQEELTAKQDLAMVAVKFVEQVYVEAKGPEKYNAAAEWLAGQARKMGLQLSGAEIRALIEWALREIKDQLGEEWANISKKELA